MAVGRLRRDRNRHRDKAATVSDAIIVVLLFLVFFGLVLLVLGWG